MLDRISNDEKLSNDTLLDLKEAFSYLSNDEKKLVINRYYKDLTQKDVAELMGVNQVYVSRLEKKVLKKMKKYSNPTGYGLLIAEKPSAMNTIKDVYFKIKDKLSFKLDFACCLGHLIGLAEPGSYME